MSIEITHVRLFIGGSTHEQVMGYKWRGIDFAQLGAADVPTLVDWITNQGGKAYVGSGANAVAVGVVRPDAGSPYVRAYADGFWTDDLMSLPHF